MLSHSRWLSVYPAALPLLLIIAAIGCKDGCDGPTGDEVWGGPVRAPLLAPYGGRWQFSLDRTLEAWRSAGRSEEEIARVRAMYASRAGLEITEDVARRLREQGIDPEQVQASMGRMHPDIRIDGHIVLCDGVPEAEYRLFGLHQHDTVVCGKAWHHEDRHDHGDMSKCHVRLTRLDDALHLAVRMHDGLPELDDPT